MQIKGLIIGAIALAAFQTVPTIAQTVVASQADSAKGSQQIEEVVVTAQKRAENLQDVPIAVSVVTASQLAQADANGILDLRLVIPTLNVTLSGGYVTYALRGLGSNGFGVGVENPIALYVDGVYIAAPAASLMSLNNIAQVEVLKGPQGTLFGRNATGGLIQITTKDPTQQSTGDLSLTYGNFNTIGADAYVSGGLTNAVTADLAVHASHQGDGWGTNLFDGHDVYRVDHDVAVRSKINFDPNPETHFSLTLDDSDNRNSLVAYHLPPGTLSGFPPPAGLPPLGPTPNIGYNIDSDVDPLLTIRSSGASLRWDQEIGGLKFTSISALRDSRTNFINDNDTTQYDTESYNIVQRDNQFSQEFQLRSDTASKLTWLLGSYYFHASDKYDPFFLVANDLGVDVHLLNTQTTSSIAGYGQATYEIFDATHLTVGGRYTNEEHKTFDGVTQITVLPSLFEPPPSDAPNRSATFDKFTYRVSLDHRYSDAVLAYASFDTGFKSGGFNVATPGSDPYQPETLAAYEIGLKTDLLDKRVRLNVAGYYYNYKDVQVDQLVNGLVSVVNGAVAHIYGVDGDISAKVTDSLRLDASFGAASPKFTSFPNCAIGVAVGGAPSTPGDCAGNLLPLASRFVASLGADYTQAVGTGSINFSGGAYFNSGFYFESDNVIKQSSFAELGSAVTYSARNGMYVRAFGKNLTNERVIAFENTSQSGGHYNYYAAPRTYGITVGVKY